MEAEIKMTAVKNAHLIAAAPELLAALKTLERYIMDEESCPACGMSVAAHVPYSDSGDIADCPVTVARAAIAKAEGGEAEDAELMKDPAYRRFIEKRKPDDEEPASQQPPEAAPSGKHLPGQVTSKTGVSPDPLDGPCAKCGEAGPQASVCYLRWPVCKSCLVAWKAAYNRRENLADGGLRLFVEWLRPGAKP